MKTYVTFTVDDKILHDFRATCKRKAMCYSKAIEQLLQSFIESNKNDPILPD